MFPLTFTSVLRTDFGKHPHVDLRLYTTYSFLCNKLSKFSIHYPHGKDEAGMPGTQIY